MSRYDWLCRDLSRRDLIRGIWSAPATRRCFAWYIFFLSRSELCRLYCTYVPIKDNV